MENFQKICSQLTKQLGRCLEERELDFLRWVHKQYVLETSDIKGNCDVPE